MIYPIHSWLSPVIPKEYSLAHNPTLSALPASVLHPGVLSTPKDSRIARRHVMSGWRVLVALGIDTVQTPAEAVEIGSPTPST